MASVLLTGLLLVLHLSFASSAPVWHGLTSNAAQSSQVATWHSPVFCSVLTFCELLCLMNCVAVVLQSAVHWEVGAA